MSMDEVSVSQLAGSVAEALSSQVGLHVELARVELERDAGAILRDLAPLAVGLPLLSVGLLMGNVSVALALGSLVPPWGSWAMVAAVNFAVGTLIVRAVGQSLRRGNLAGGTLAGEVWLSGRGLVSTLLPAWRALPVAS